MIEREQPVCAKNGRKWTPETSSGMDVTGKESNMADGKVQKVISEQR